MTEPDSPPRFTDAQPHSSGIKFNAHDGEEAEAIRRAMERAPLLLTDTLSIEVSEADFAPKDQP